MPYVGYMRVEPISNNKTCEKHPHALRESHCCICMEEKRIGDFSDLAAVDPIPDKHVLFHERQQDLRTKALELALKEISFPLHDDKGNMFYERCDRLANLANRFYTYITKGE